MPTEESAYFDVQTYSELFRTVQNQKKTKRKSPRPSPPKRRPLGEDGYLVFDPQMMERERLGLGMSINKFAEHTGVSPNTAKRFFTKQRVQWARARKVFDALDIGDMKPYLLVSNRKNAGRAPIERDLDLLGEWKVENVDSHHTELSNGLTFQVCKLVHRVMPDTFARAKCYDLTELRTRDQERSAEQLLRHPTICRQLRHSPRFPTNERVLQSDDHSRFWVIDSWFDGISLEAKMRYGPLPPAVVPVVMNQILDGLESLHQAKIIRRELSPSYVTLTEPRQDVLLTELELCKLLEGAVSVSETWDEDPYRAPEVEAEEITTTVDFYSWAQILLFAVTGTPPPSPARGDLFKSTALPASVQSIAERCVAPSHRWRPQTVDEIRTAIAAWT